MTPERARLLKRIAVGAAAAAVVAVGLCVVTVWTSHYWIETGKLEEVIERASSKFLERKLTIGRLERKPFPHLELRAYDVKLADAQGRAIIECPEVVANASALSFLRLRLGVEELRFEKPFIHVWYDPAGRSNVEGIIDDIQKRRDDAMPRPVKRTVGTLFFHSFKISSGRLAVSDVPGAPAVLDGGATGEITLKFGALGMRAPFEFAFDGGDDGAQIRAVGSLGSAPSVELRAQRLPAKALSRRLAAVDACDGVADFRLDWSGGRATTIDFSLSPANLCRGDGELPERVSGRAKHAKGAWAFELVAIGSGTHATLQGQVPPAPAAMKLTLTAPRIDSDSLKRWAPAAQAIAKRAAAAAGPKSSTAPAREMTLQVNVSSFSVSRATITNVEASIHRATSSVVRADPVSASLFGGRANAKIEWREDAMLIDAEAHELKIDEIAWLFRSTDNYSGAAKVALSGWAPRGAPIVSSFTGSAEMWVENLELAKVPVILKTMASANFVKLEGDMKGKKNADFPPANGHAKAELTGGSALITEAKLENRTLRFGYTGTVNYTDRSLNGTAVLHALTLPDQILNDIPILRRLLIGKGKSFLPLWFRVTGPWNDPTVRPQPVKSLGSPIRTFFEGLLELPQDVIDAVRGAD